MVLHAAAQVNRIAPVDQADIAVTTEETVDRTYVAMNITQFMGLLKDRKRLAHNIKGKRKRKRSPESVHIFFTGHPLEVLPDKI